MHKLRTCLFEYACLSLLACLPYSLPIFLVGAAAVGVVHAPIAFVAVVTIRGVELGQGQPGRRVCQPRSETKLWSSPDRYPWDTGDTTNENSGFLTRTLGRRRGCRIDVWWLGFATAHFAAGRKPQTANEDPPDHYLKHEVRESSELAAEGCTLTCRSHRCVPAVAARRALLGGPRRGLGQSEPRSCLI